VQRERDVVRLRTRIEESRTTYFLEVERERNGVTLRRRMRREQDNVLSGGEEGA
jgi:hypothetical protein